MDKSFDFSALLKNNEKTHKRKPPQFGSVASGVKIRLQTSLKNRKSSRCTIYDRVRDISECNSPEPGPAPSEAQLKVEHRRQQLERWKEEKMKKKQEQMAQKKKPFVAGIARPPLKFVPPPPVPKPSTSGRVTRSQSAKANSVLPKSNSASRATQSFAPKNAQFRAPKIKTVAKLPVLAPLSKSTINKPINVTFEPVIPKQVNTVKQTRARTAAINRKTAAESSIKQSKSQTDLKNVKTKINAKSIPVTYPRTTRTNNKKVLETQSSSSGSDVAPSDIKKRIQTPGPTKSMQEKKTFTAKVSTLEFTTSDEISSPEKKSVKRKSERKIVEIISTDEKLNSESTSSVEDLGTVRKPYRKSVQNNFSPTVPSLSDSCSSDVEFISEEADFKKTPRKSMSTPKNRKVPKSESSSEEKLRSPKSPIQCPLTPEQMEDAKISPCVTLSRGKDNARKEMKWKMEEGLLDDDTSQGDSVEHFRYQLASETDRMTAKCLEWDKILEQAGDQMPDDVQELVLSAVGQARLLMSQKLQQFRSLMERCAKPDPGAALVTPADLRGFWDMVFIQVENVDMRFKTLEELRARDWVEDKPVVVKKQAPRAKAKKVAKPAASSGLRNMIAAARKAKKEQESQPCAPTERELVPPEPQKTFEAGFFCIHSPVKSPGSAAATPRKESTLLKAVLSSEAKKCASKHSASFAMLRASIFSKNVECDGVAPLQQTPQMTPINLYATPGRSILKSNTKSSAKKSEKKSLKLVLFNESDEDLSFMSLLSDKPETARENNTEENSIENIVEFLSGISSMDVEKTLKNKTKAKAKFVRQNAIESTPVIENTDERSPIMTRRRRKSIQTPKEATNNVDIDNEVKSTKRSTRKKKSNIEEDGKEIKSKTPKKNSMVEEDIEVKTKTKASRQRKKANAEQEIKQETEEDDKEKTPKRSTRKKALQELEINVLETEVAPKRSPRARRSEFEMLMSDLD